MPRPRRAVDRVKEAVEIAPGFRIDPATGELLGNLLRAFRHLGSVNAAWAIDQARMPASSGPTQRPSGGRR